MIKDYKKKYTDLKGAILHLRNVHNFLGICLILWLFIGIKPVIYEFCNENQLYDGLSIWSVSIAIYYYWFGFALLILGNFFFYSLKDTQPFTFKFLKGNELLLMGSSISIVGTVNVN